MPSVHVYETMLLKKPNCKLNNHQSVSASPHLVEQKLSKVTHWHAPRGWIFLFGVPRSSGDLLLQVQQVAKSSFGMSSRTQLSFFTKPFPSFSYFPPPPMADCRLFGWASNYLTYSISAAAQRMYDNDNGTLDHYAAFWSRVATAFQNTSGILGMDVSC